MKYLITIAALVWAGTIVFLVSCSEEDVAKGPTAYTFPDIFYYPNNLNIPADNPTTEEGVLLGRYLFYDGRFSGRTHPDSLMSCSTCHVQASGFDTGFDHPDFPSGRPHGLAGTETHHYTLPLVNLVYNSNGYFWNGFVHEQNIEGIVLMTVIDPNEVKGTYDQTVQAISDEPMYPPMFKDAFGTEEVTMDRIAKAIAQFVRTIIANKTKYHRYIEGKTVLSESETRGMELFFSEEADCFHCHGGFLMSTYDYFNNAKDTIFTDPFDRKSITGDPMDLGAYRAPPLINVELTGPYMHDGRFKTLEEVVDFYSEGVVLSPYNHPLMKYTSSGGVGLTDQEKQDLIAFLKTLTDHELLMNPDLGKPSDLAY